MTGRNRGRGSRDAWRGPRELPRTLQEDPRPDRVPARPELEELPGQAVAARRRSGVPLGALGAGAAIAILLAAGFGLLGGRDQAAPSLPAGTADAAASAPSETLDGGPAVEPLVTPWAPCIPPEGPPELVLQVNGRPYPGLPTLVDPTIDAIPVPVDVITEIWISGAACATWWGIDLVPPGRPRSGGTRLETSPRMAEGDGLVEQNRFRLFLYPWSGHHTLVADFVVGRSGAFAAWPIEITPVEPPAPALTIRSDAAKAIPLTIGCDATLTFGVSGGSPDPAFEQRLNPCDDDMADLPELTRIALDSELEFSMPGWDLDAVLVVCGRLSGLSFIAEPEPLCELRLDGPRGSVRFPAPNNRGPLILAISVCASRAQSVGVGQNRVCGTWYAQLVARG